MDIRDILGKEYLIFDGAMGSLLQKRGLGTSELPEEWNIKHCEEIIAVHKEYLEAGVNILKTNTFGANCFKHPDNGEVETIIKAAVGNARKAIESMTDSKPRFVALDIGPTGKLLKPFGELDFEDAVSAFAQMIRAGKDEADLILIETMSDLYETKAAVLAAKENCDLPVFVTTAYTEFGRLMTGASPEIVCAAMEGLGVDAIGLNCSFGPKEMFPVVKKLAEVSSVPVIVNPNAGLPVYKDGETTYSIDENEFAQYMKDILPLGVHVLGGCCGTTPDYIRALAKVLEGKKPNAPSCKDFSVVVSYNRAVDFDDINSISLGNKINPSSDEDIRQAIIDEDFDTITDEAIDQEDEDADVVCVNVKVDGVDEKTAMVSVVREIQALTGVPLCINTDNTEVLEAALRIYNGKAMIDFENGVKCADKIFGIVKKYGGVVRFINIDGDVEEYVNEINECAVKHNISKKDYIIDFVKA